METFLEYETKCREPPLWTRVRGKFGGNRSRESGRSGSRHIRLLQYSAIRSDIGSYQIADNDPIGYRIADNYIMLDYHTVRCLSLRYTVSSGETVRCAIIFKRP